MWLPEGAVFWGEYQQVACEERSGVQEEAWSVCQDPKASSISNILVPACCCAPPSMCSSCLQ